MTRKKIDLADLRIAGGSTTAARAPRPRTAFTAAQKAIWPHPERPSETYLHDDTDPDCRCDLCGHWNVGREPIRPFTVYRKEVFDA